ncbi:MAG TPA: DUF2844 domain-containing protein [Terriglobia bacterium]|nr:DUF2844 domain-containing protein [Terriglobia bacterium]
MKTTIAVLSTLLVAAAPAWAVLGGSVDSVRADQTRLEAKVHSVTLPGYTVHEISRGDGTTIKEFVSPLGTVFGVSWKGPTMPDLTPLLGTYYSQFRQAMEGRRHRGPVVVRTNDLVVESGGHLRAFHGRAYVTSLIPNTLSPAVVQ